MFSSLIDGVLIMNEGAVSSCRDLVTLREFTFPNKPAVPDLLTGRQQVVIRPA